MNDSATIFLKTASSVKLTDEELTRALDSYLHDSGYGAAHRVCFFDDTFDLVQDAHTSISDENSLLLIHAALSDADDASSPVVYRVIHSFTSDQVKVMKASPQSVEQLHALCMTMCEAPLPESSVSEISLSNLTEKFHPLKPCGDVLSELEELQEEHHLLSSNHLSLYLFKGSEAPAMMQLIGKARAVTFAAIGAGAGKEIDLAEEDSYYHHLLLWDDNEMTLVGAYRLGFTEDVFASEGMSGMYLSQVFEIKSSFYEQIGNAIELSRSFILPAYQKNPQMLDMLWKGLGIAAKKKECYTLYGSVTISSSFTPLSQAILVDLLDRYYGDLTKLRASVKAKCPFLAATEYHSLIADAWSQLSLAKLNDVILNLEGQQRSIPPLIRYYVSLGAKFLSFQVEESFNDAIYCLLRVDLKKLPRRYKKRFLSGSSQSD